MKNSFLSVMLSLSWFKNVKSRKNAYKNKSLRLSCVCFAVTRIFHRICTPGEAWESTRRMFDDLSTSLT